IIHTDPVNYDRSFLSTTVGRAILNDHLPESMPYINGLLKKKGIGQLVNYCYLRFGLETTVKMLDEVKELGFRYATRAGLSIGIDDMVIPDNKKILVRDGEKQAVSVQQQYLDGAITNGERYNKVIEIWSAITEKVADEMLGDRDRDFIVSECECGTVDGIYRSGIVDAGEIIEPLRDHIVGRVSLEKIKDYDGNVVVDINQEITEELASSIQAAGIERVKIRSVLTCESKRGVCVMCYGRNLASGRLVELGEATGVIAAQSIGEPGTQLTMRTFHIGGTASRVSEQSRLDAKNTGTVRFINVQTVKSKTGDLVVMNRQGSIAIVDEKGREREHYSVVYGAKVKVNEGDQVQLGQVMVEWDPYTFAILTEIGGTVLFEARKPHETAVISEIDGTVKFGEVAKGQRKLYVQADNGTEKEYSVPRGVHINVQEGERVRAGEPLMDGPLNPHDILAVLGEKELQGYLVNEIQEVYRLQGVTISDKHIEVIVRQMMRWVKVEDVGDTTFLLEQQSD